MRLTKRDIDILLKVNECYWLSTTQIKRYFFPSTTFRMVNKRLNLLVKGKYLNCARNSIIEDYYFKLGSKGKITLVTKSDLPLESMNIPRSLPIQLKHFSMLNDLRWYWEKSIIAHKGKLDFYFIDRELGGFFKDSIIIPDVVTCFSFNIQKQKKRFICLVEYDAGTENPQYFGRDKMKKYSEMFLSSHPILANRSVYFVVFSDTRKKVFQLIKYSLKFLHPEMKVYFGSVEDLIKFNDIFAKMFINPNKQFHDNKVISSIIEEIDCE